MTENVYDKAIEKIKRRLVNPPRGLTPQEFNMWAQGYCDGVQSSVDAVELLKEEEVDR